MNIKLSPSRIAGLAKLMVVITITVRGKHDGYGYEYSTK